MIFCWVKWGINMMIVIRISRLYVHLMSYVHILLLVSLEAFMCLLCLYWFTHVSMYEKFGGMVDVYLFHSRQRFSLPRYSEKWLLGC
jgi:hypothetical protein